MDPSSSLSKIERTIAFGILIFTIGYPLLVYLLT